MSPPAATENTRDITDITSKKESPFTTGALSTDVGFWESYIAGRPSPDESFFELIKKYHTSHGDPRSDVVHDVGTGPGNIARRLIPYYQHVVGSDINEKALAAVPALSSGEQLQRTTFVKSPAEDVANPSLLPENIGRGNTDTVVVSECMPLLDPQTSLEAFHTLLRPGGTLAIYFYGRPIFVEGSGSGNGNAAACDSIYDRTATKICSFLGPFKGTPGYPFHRRGAESLISEMDNLPLPSHSWENVQRLKWNCHRPLLFCSKEGFDFEFEPIDRREAGEMCPESVADDNYWVKEWDADQIADYLASVFPNYRAKAGERYGEIEAMLEELRTAMGGGKSTMKVTFPVVLILATSKKQTPSGPNGMDGVKWQYAEDEVAASKVKMSADHLGIARIDACPEGTLEVANELLQKNHDDYHMFWRDVGGHNHIPHSVLSVLALGGGPDQLRRAYADGVDIQRAMPPLDLNVVAELSNPDKFRARMRNLPEYRNFLYFFEREVQAKGWQAVVHEYCFSHTPLAETMLAQLFEGAYHPIIHLGFGIEFALPSVVAEGLAQAAVHDPANIESFFQCSEQFARSGSVPAKPLVEVYSDIRNNTKLKNAARMQDGPVRVRDGVLGRAFDQMVLVASQFQVSPEDVDRGVAEMISCAAFSAGAAQKNGKARKVDFFHMHNTTSSLFLTVLAQQPWISQADKARLVEWKGRLDLVWYAASSAAELKSEDISSYEPTLSKGMDWRALYRAVNDAHDDGHVAKIIRALKNGEDAARPFGGEPSFPVQGDMWLKIAQMSYDTTLDVPVDDKWIWGAGYEPLWAKFADA